jgi:hypothetical protein
VNLYINRIQNKADFRQALYAGDIFLNTDLQAAKDLCAFARESITRAFDGETEHQSLHEKMPVADFVEHVSRLKREFTNHVRSKEMIRDFVREIGADPRDFLLDVPRIRVVPHYDYLHAGVSYAYLPHRDTWYGGVACQINTWMPVYSISPDQTMMINPGYFTKPVRNTSADWSLADWVNVQRPLATQNITEESRVHPVPLEEIDQSSEVRVAANSGEILVFSGSHLHGTVPNRTAQTRFSVDFRLMHLGDLMEKRGAANVDSGTSDVEAGYKDYFHVSDFRSFQGVGQ